MRHQGRNISRDHLARQGITIIRFENKHVIANPVIVSEAVCSLADGARE